MLLLITFNPSWSDGLEVLKKSDPSWCAVTLAKHDRLMLLAEVYSQQYLDLLLKAKQGNFIYRAHFITKELSSLHFKFRFKCQYSFYSSQLIHSD